jgi:hypothetical protein
LENRVRLGTEVSQSLRDQLRDTAKAKGMLLGPFIEQILTEAVGKPKESKKPKPPQSKALAISKEDTQLTDFFYKEIGSNHPYMKRQPKPADYQIIDTLIGSFGRDTVVRAMKVGVRHDFWKKQVRSASGLKKHFEALLAEEATAQKKVYSV